MRKIPGTDSRMLSPAPAKAKLLASVESRIPSAGMPGMGPPWPHSDRIISLSSGIMLAPTTPGISQACPTEHPLS
eukprot:Skav223080  [mRNA]  locus=scaffold419:230085:230309:- [translate_table: standard]